MDSAQPSMPRPGKIAGFGIPLLDFIAEVDDFFLKKYQLKSNASSQANKDQDGMYSELTQHPDVQIVPGGAVPNALRIAQWLLAIPRVTISIGCIGDDEFGRTLTNKSKSEGVCVQYQVHPQMPTGTCAVLITKQNRCLCANFAAARYLSSSFIDRQETQELIRSATCLYVVGYFVHTYPGISQRLADLSNREGKVLALNLSATYVCQQSTSILMRMIGCADFVFGNVTELQSLAEALCWKTDEMSHLMMKLSNLPSIPQSSSKIRHIVITHGPLPTIWCDGTSVKIFNVAHVDEERIVDTCGAGDAFVGGFLSQLILQKSINECIRCGHYAAGWSIQQRGMTIEGSPHFR